MQLRKKSFFTAALALTLALLSAVYCGVIPVSAASMAQLREQQAALENKEKENEKLIEKLQNDSKHMREYTEAVNSQIETVKAQADLILARITELDSAKADFESERPQKEKEIQQIYLKLKSGTKSINMGENVEDLKILMGDKTFSVYAAGSGGKLSVNDSALVKTLSENMEYLRKKEKSLSADKNELERIKKELDAKSEELTALYAKAQELVKSAEKTEAEAKAEAEAAAAEKLKTEQAIDEWFSEYRQKQIEVNGDSAVNLGGEGFAAIGQLMWPMPGYTDITCYFGDDGHRGIDIAGSGIYGKSIVSADDGVVAFAGEMGTYGNVVFVDHGNGIQTRYAHMSAIGCTVGQSVTQGQVVGYVGSTGNSTGPHLHFEVIYGDQLVNPFLFY